MATTSGDGELKEDSAGNESMPIEHRLDDPNDSAAVTKRKLTCATGLASMQRAAAPSSGAAAELGMQLPTGAGAARLWRANCARLAATGPRPRQPPRHAFPGGTATQQGRGAAAHSMAQRASARQHPPPPSACCLFRRCAPPGCLKKHLYIYIYINMDSQKGCRFSKGC